MRGVHREGATYRRLVQEFEVGGDHAVNMIITATALERLAQVNEAPEQLSEYAVYIREVAVTLMTIIADASDMLLEPTFPASPQGFQKVSPKALRKFWNRITFLMAPHKYGPSVLLVKMMEDKYHDMSYGSLVGAATDTMLEVKEQTAAWADALISLASQTREAFDDAQTQTAYGLEVLGPEEDLHEIGLKVFTMLKEISADTQAVITMVDDLIANSGKGMIIDADELRKQAKGMLTESHLRYIVLGGARKSYNPLPLAKLIQRKAWKKMGIWCETAPDWNDPAYHDHDLYLEALRAALQAQLDASDEQE